MSTGSILNMAMSATVLLFALQLGKVNDVAGYYAGTAALAVVAVALSGGATLMYVASDPATRGQLVWRRLVFVTPLLCLAAVVLVGYYSRSALPVQSVALAAGAVILNNLSELPLAECQVSNKFFSWVASFLVGKSIAIVLVAADTRMTTALVVGNLVQLGLSVAPVGRRLQANHRRRSHRRSGAGQRGPLVSAYNEALIQRIPTVWSTVVGTPHQIATVGTLAFTLQAAVVPLASAGYLIAIRGESAIAPEARLRLAAVLTGAATALAIVATLSLEQIVAILNLPEEADARLWLGIAVWAVPIALVNRLVQYRRIADRDFRTGAWILFVILVTQVIILLGFALVRPDPLSGFPWSIVGGELAGLTVAGILVLRRRRSVREFARDEQG